MKVSVRPWTCRDSTFKMIIIIRHMNQIKLILARYNVVYVLNHIISIFIKYRRILQWQLLSMSHRRQYKTRVNQHRALNNLFLVYLSF